MTKFFQASFNKLSKTAMGTRSGLTKEQKNGEVAMSILKSLDYSKLIGFEYIGRGVSIEGRIILLCSKKINNVLENQKIQSKKEIDISEDDVAFIGRLPKTDNIKFTQQEKQSRDIDKAINIIKELKRNICGNSDVKAKYFDKFLLELEGSIEIDERSIIDYNQKQAHIDAQNFARRTKKFEDSENRIENLVNETRINHMFYQGFRKQGIIPFPTPNYLID